VFSAKEPVFKTEPLFVLGCPHDVFARYMKRRFGLEVDDSRGAIGTMYTFQRDPQRVIWTLKLDAAEVLHEVFHLVTRICHDKGVPIVAHHPNGDNGDETAAYLFEFFARAALRRLP
jgi:hypothetical protein